MILIEREHRPFRLLFDCPCLVSCSPPHFMLSSRAHLVFSSVTLLSTSRFAVETAFASLSTHPHTPLSPHSLRINIMLAFSRSSSDFTLRYIELFSRTGESFHLAFACFGRIASPGRRFKNRLGRHAFAFGGSR